MAWIWDPATALDFARYVVLVASISGHGEQPVWQDLAYPVVERYDHSAQVPALGECLIYDIKSEDASGNRSE